MIYMSIATLKRKSNHTHGSFHSNGTNGFSLNGVHRTNTYIGKTALGQHYPRTLMKGSVARGHGGCCGTYNEVATVESIACNTTEDATTVKSSVLNTRGMIATKYRWVNRPYPYATVKPNSWIQASPFRPFCM